MLLLLLLLYVFGIVFKLLCEQSGELQLHFPTVFVAMYRLFMHGSLLDSCTVTMDLIRGESITLAVLFLVFIILSSFVTLNMLIGVLCDVFREVSAAEKDKKARTCLRNMLTGLLEAYDKQDDQHIAKHEFTLLLT